jgi:hypothetical protein
MYALGKVLLRQAPAQLQQMLADVVASPRSKVTSKKEALRLLAGLRLPGALEVVLPLFAPGAKAHKDVLLACLPVVKAHLHDDRAWQVLAEIVGWQGKARRDGPTAVLQTPVHTIPTAHHGRWYALLLGAVDHPEAEVRWHAGTALQLMPPPSVGAATAAATRLMRMIVDLDDDSWDMALKPCVSTLGHIAALSQHQDGAMSSSAAASTAPLTFPSLLKPLLALLDDAAVALFKRPEAHPWPVAPGGSARPGLARVRAFLAAATISNRAPTAAAATVYATLVADLARDERVAKPLARLNVAAFVRDPSSTGQWLHALAQPPFAERTAASWLLLEGALDTAEWSHPTMTPDRLANLCADLFADDKSDSTDASLDPLRARVAIYAAARFAGSGYVHANPTANPEEDPALALLAMVKSVLLRLRAHPDARVRLAAWDVDL